MIKYAIFNSSTCECSKSVHIMSMTGAPTTALAGHLLLGGLLEIIYADETKKAIS